jgi:hypothetical protein
VFSEDPERFAVLVDQATADTPDLFAHLLGRQEAELAARQLLDEDRAARLESLRQERERRGSNPDLRR